MGGRRIRSEVLPATEAPRLGPHKTVLAAVDIGGPRGRSRTVLEVAAALGRGRVHVVYGWNLVGASILTCRVRGPSPDRMRSVLSAIGRRHRERLLELCEEVLPAGPEGVIVRRGNPRAVVPAAARKVQADLVVLGGSSDAGFRHRLLGSVARAVVDRVPCDVLTVRGRFRW